MMTEPSAESPRPGAPAPHSPSIPPRRGQADRRRVPTRPLDAFRLAGRRGHVRRQAERTGAYFTDRWGVCTLLLIVLVLVLSLADGMLTIELLDRSAVELNPFMRFLLERGHQPFLMGKYLITAAGLPFLVVYQNWPLFGTRFRAGFLLPIFVGLYLGLLTYQVRLLGS